MQHHPWVRRIRLVQHTGTLGLVLAMILLGLRLGTSDTPVAVAGTLPGGSCADLPGYDQLKAALVTARAAQNGGFNLDMWGTIVNRDGVVCAVAFTGATRGDQWPGSRVISAQKANTANAFSLPKLALSSAQLYTAVQPGGSLFGLQESNPVDVAAAYGGQGDDYGQRTDPLVGKKIGGVNVFGGGLALYSASGALLGALGVSGDTSCADHAIAWRTRNSLRLDYVPAGVSGDASRPDSIVYTAGSPWMHPHCLDADIETVIATALPPVPHAP